MSNLYPQDVARRAIADVLELDLKVLNMLWYMVYGKAYIKIGTSRKGINRGKKTVVSNHRRRDKRTGRFLNGSTSSHETATACCEDVC